MRERAVKEREDGEGRGRDRGGREDWAEGHLAKALADKNGEAASHREKELVREGEISLSLLIG